MKLDMSKLVAKPRVLAAEDSETKTLIAADTRAADARIAEDDEAMTKAIQASTLPQIMPGDRTKDYGVNMSKLIDEEFPFDPSQLEAIIGISTNKYACMTGAAGTGKTTCLKAAVDRIQDSLPAIDMTDYFKKSNPDDAVGDDPDDDYQAPTSLIPAVALCSFTGRATQMIKKNFPDDWHGNIMTIHRLLAYVPEWYPDYDNWDGVGKPKNKVRFIPTYNAEFKLPWKVIIIDEAGMLGMDLWNALFAACKPDTRIIMVGDINQLPPTHGKPIFGFAMARWPSWELTHIHRQKGKNNSVVDAAWAIINGQYPKSDDVKTDPDWKFVMMEIEADPAKASRRVRKWLEQIRGPLYDPLKHVVITPINGYEETAGWQLGQDPLNRELALRFNSEEGRYVIDAGRDRRMFAVGDKVMATKNDHSIGITNGMTGIITKIAANGLYGGNHQRFGLMADVEQYYKDMADIDSVEDDVDLSEISLEDLVSKAVDSESKKKEESNRGHASHSVTVNFGFDDVEKLVTFSTFAELESLRMAYVMTCHKMQGGESEFVVVIVHQSHKRTLNREWFYTAVTRTSQRVVILYTRMGMSAAINKQTIKGRTLKEKVESFNKIIDISGKLGNAINLPESTETSTGQSIAASPAREVAKPQSIPLGAAGKPSTVDPIVRERIIERVIERIVMAPVPAPVVVKDGGVIHKEPAELKPVYVKPLATEEVNRRLEAAAGKIDRLIAAPVHNPVVLRPQVGAARMIQTIETNRDMAQHLLPAPKLKPITPGVKINLFQLKRK